MRILFVCWLFLLTHPVYAESEVIVDVWQPAFNSTHIHQPQTYKFSQSANKKWKVCVAIPHLKDSYWLAVNYGLIKRARQLNISVTIFSAGSYENLENQRMQVASCLTENYDALILASVSQDGLNDLIDKYSQANKPVIDLINTVSSTKISARTAADFFELASKTAEYINQLSQSAKIIWLPGPSGAGWSQQANAGFNSALTNNHKIVDTLWGDTGLAVQSQLIKQALNEHDNDVDLIIGTAVSAEAAVAELRRQKLSSSIQVASYYFSPGVYRGLTRGYILASPTDNPSLQAELAIDVAVKALQGETHPKHLSAPITFFTQENIDSQDLSGSLAPQGFRPVFTSD